MLPDVVAKIEKGMSSNSDSYRSVNVMSTSAANRKIDAEAAREKRLAALREKEEEASSRSKKTWATKKSKTYDYDDFDDFENRDIGTDDYAF